MPTAAAQLLMFFSSFAPLFVVFGLLGSFGTGAGRVACYTIAVLAFLGLFVLLRAARHLGKQTLKADRARPRDSDAIAYVVTYLVPFLTLATDSWQARAALAVFVLVVAVLYVRAHLFYVNPVLSLFFGYRLFEVETGESYSIVLSKRRYIAPGTELNTRRLSDYVFIEEG